MLDFSTGQTTSCELLLRSLAPSPPTVKSSHPSGERDFPTGYNYHRFLVLVKRDKKPTNAHIIAYFLILSSALWHQDETSPLTRHG
jgi:hypothetical protein